MMASNYAVFSRHGLVGLVYVLLCFSPAAQANGDNDDDADFETSQYSKIAMPNFGGRLVYDAAYYREDTRKLGSGSAISSARLSMSGKVDENWRYRLEYDFAAGGSLKNAWIGLWSKANYRVKVGNLLEPFSMEETTSSRHISFIERALPNAFAPSYHLGAVLETWGSRSSMSIGMFGDSAASGPSDEEDEGYGISARLTYALEKSNDVVVHLGSSAALRNPGEDATARFRARPESDITDERFVDTGRLRNVSSYAVEGFEIAARFYSLTLQAEAMKSQVLFDNGDDTLEFSGGYAQMSWLFGGKRSYKRNGTFGAVNIEGGKGAWEVSVRQSYLNLNSGVIEGGEQTNSTLGINYYISTDLRWMFNYIVVDVEKGGNTEKPKVVALRLQASF